MFFRDIVGYESIKEQLCHLATSGRVPHAVLFDVTDGMPALHMAWAWAQYLNCPHRSETESCGECPSCKKNAALVHPDLFFSFPVVNASGESDPCELFMGDWTHFLKESSPYLTFQDWTLRLNAGNSQPVIYVKEVESIIERLATTRSEGGYRIGIIYCPERMNEAAANKLLKSLEEPPEQTLFILISYEPAKLLDTILSRMQIIEWPPLSKEELAIVVRHEYPSATDQQIAEAFAISMGNPHEALALWSNSESLETLIDWQETLLELVLSRNTAQLKAFAEEMAEEGREACVSLLSSVSRLTQQLLYARVTQTPFPMAKQYQNPMLLTRFFNLLDAHLAGRIYALIELGIQDIRGNVLTKLVLFNTFTLLTQYVAQQSR